MSIRILVIALMSFLLIAVIDKNKPIVRKGGEILIALFVLLINIFAEFGLISTLATQLSVEEVYFFAREIIHAFGLTGSSLISMQVFALSTVAMFTLLWMECKSQLFLMKDELLCENVEIKQFNLFGSINEFDVFSRTQFYAKMRN